MLDMIVANATLMLDRLNARVSMLATSSIEAIFILFGSLNIFGNQYAVAMLPNMNLNDRKSQGFSIAPAAINVLPKPPIVTATRRAAKGKRWRFFCIVSLSEFIFI